MMTLISYFTCALFLSFWTSGDALGCNKSQDTVNGICCNLCPPGHYMSGLCTNERQTQCSPCPEGYYADHYHLFDRCTKCTTCKDISAKCTPTTNTNCCPSGFLCSDSKCTSCREVKCAAGEKAVRTGQKEYSYRCESCRDHEYLDANTMTCRPITKCQTYGLRELFQGNKSHDSICEKHGDSYVVVLGTCFVLVSLTLLVLLIHVCAHKIHRQKAKKPAAEILALQSSTCDYHLSKEESGIELKLKESQSSSDRQLQLETLVLV